MMRTATLCLLGLVLAGCDVETGLRVDPECLASTCRTGGRCSFIDGRCVIGSDEDCRQSLPCFEFGRCAAKNPGTAGATCVVGSTADCQQSDYCRDYGMCTLTPASGSCRASSDEDCQQSVICVTDGYCHCAQNSCRPTS